MNIIEKSKNDNRNYSWIELENKLKVIIIQDKSNKNCGALLNVKVGSIYDNIPGMAHFVEHMVFMGSKKYPDVTSFFDNISKNGGETNAMTSDMDTTYYFTVESTNFLSSLDMFAHFFIDPLFIKEYVDKEISSVNSEAIKNILDENWISQEMIKKSLLDDFPINHFTCGNKKTLSIKNIDILVKEFFDKYYSSNLMHLILFINNDIDGHNLTKLIKDTFSKIKNKNLSVERKFGQLIKSSQLIEYIPNKNNDNLIISTQIEVNYNDLTDNPFNFLFWITSNKSKNSLFKIYESHNYISDFSLNDFFVYDDYALLITRFNLTDKGYKNIDEIIRIYFEYFDSIKINDELEEIYNDMINQNKKYFEFHENTDVVDTLLDFNNLLINKINPINLLNFKINYKSFDDMKINIKNLLKNIKLYNSNFIIGSIKNKLTKILTDENYDIKYSINKMYPIKLNKQKYNLIEKNKYITTDIALLSGNDIFPNKNPEKIDKQYNLFYNFNNSFKLPIVNIYACLDIKNFLKSPETYTQIILFIDTIYSDNIDIINTVRQAGYSISIDVENESLYIYISGDNKIIDTLIDDFNNILSIKATGICFDAVKEKTHKFFKNSINDQVIYKISNLIGKKLIKKYYDYYDLFPFIKNSNFDTCKSTFFNCIKESITSILISGNINKDDAIKLADKLYSNFGIEKELEPNFTNNLKTKSTFPYIDTYYNLNIKEKNTLFTLMFELFSIKKGDTNYTDNIAFLILLNSITNTQYFNALRTDEQLGYIVYTKISYIGNKNLKNGFFKFVIQSPNQTSDILYKKTIDFIQTKLYNFIKNLGEDSFYEYKTGEISNISNKFNNLAELDLYLCSNIFDHSNNFTYKKDLITAIKNIKFDRFIKLFEKYILNNNKIYSISIDPYKDDIDKKY